MPGAREGHDHVSSHADAQHFWREQLAGRTAEPFPDLTGNRPRAKNGKNGRETIRSRLSFDELQNSATKHATTPLVIAQAAWAVLLHTYSEGETTFVTFGSAAREPVYHYAPTILELPGTSIASAESFTIVNVLSRLSGVNVVAQKHPFLVENQNELSHDTAISVRPTNSEPFELPDTIAVSVEVLLDLTNGSIVLAANYSTHVLTSVAAICVLDQLDDILAHILSNPDAPFLTAYTAVRPSLQSARNPNPPLLPTPAGPLLHSWFERHARETPDALALWFKHSLDSHPAQADVRWTYAELNALANRLARVLRALLGGSISDEPVPLLMEKGPGLYLSMLAVLKAGGAWCPLDAAAPALRNRDMLARAGGRLVIFDTEERKASALRDEVVPEGVITISLEDPIIAEELDDSNLNLSIPPNHLAYLIWTSGTTGLPKGVPVEHRAIVQTIASEEQAIPWDEATGVRHMQFSAATFDVSITDIFYTWAKPCGAVTTATRELLVGRFPELVNAFKATHCNLTPSFMATFPLSECPTMKVVCSEGEKLPDVVADAWNVAGGVSVNCYGPAECAVTIITRSWKAGEDKKAANVGHPLASGSCFAVRGDTILPRGAAGELALGGPQLARGYLGQPDKTAAKFVEHPIAGRIYLTGDVVRFLHDGTCEFVGRNDDLIKLGGIRIELSEISASLNRSHPLAREAATFQLRRPDRPMNVICTFMAVPSLPTPWALKPTPLAVEVVQSAKSTAERMLPSYMLPHVYVPVQRIPVTASNKIDRKALAAIYTKFDLTAWEMELGVTDGGKAKVGDVEGDSEWTEVEKKLREAIIDLTKVSPDAVSKGTPLKALGIDSIHAIFLGSRFRSLGIDIAVADIIEHNSIRALRQVMERGQSSVRKPRDQPALPVRQRFQNFNQAWLPFVQREINGVGKVMPCTPLQEGSLGETLQNPRSYWTHHLLTLEVEVDIERLKTAWRIVAQANEALRAGFVPSATLPQSGEVSQDVSSVFLQAVFRDAQLDWTTVEASGALEDAVHERADAFVTSRQGLHLPPWGLALFEFNSDRRVLMLSIHHSIYDADTLNFILEDVQFTYSSGLPRDRPQLSEALLLTQPASLDDSIGFWSNTLADYADPDSPAFPNLSNRGRPNTENKFSGIFHRVPTSASSTAISAAAQQLDAPFGNIIQVAWAVVLCAHLETSTVVFGETTSDRLRAPSLGAVYGPMVVAAPVPCQLAEDTTCRTLVAELTKVYNASLPYRHVQLAKIRQALKRPSNQAVFESMFVVHVESDSEDSMQQAKPIWTRHPDVVGLSVEHALALNVEVRKTGSIELEIWANENVISQSQLELLAQEVDGVLSAIIANPDHPLTRITTLPDFPERLLSVSQPIPSVYLRNTRELTPTWALEHYAEKHPTYMALIVASAIKASGAIARQWTYRELNENANRVGNFLLSLGIQEKVVGFSMPRTLESYAYQIGIFKSGNTYLPIEEDLPVARKLLLMTDSCSPIVLTTRDMADQFAECEPEVQVIHVDSMIHKATLAKQPASAPERRYNPDAVAYVLYTSGSTGTPKGVMVSYHNLTAFIAAVTELIDRDVPIKENAGKGRYLGRTSIAFDPHLFEILGTFSQGLAIASAPRSMILDDLRLTMQTLRVTHASLVPSLLERSGMTPSEVPLLRWMSVGGEKISARVVDVWGNEPGGFVLYNAYGPTELTIGCSMSRVTKDSSTRNIGKIFSNCTAYVLRPGTLEPVLRGEPGELCVTGDLVALGYLNRPDAKGFINEFHGGRMYRTGDMVRLMADDTIDYLGRSDDQAKVRGQRLELAEVTEFLRANAPEGAAISTLIARHPIMNRDWLVSFVGDSALYIRANKAMDPSINHSKRYIADDLQNTCREQLPAFMVPDIIIMVDFIPLAFNSGKADAKLLRKLLKETPLDVILGEAPGSQRTTLNATERRVQDVLADFIKINPQWTPSMTTLELGIDSLTAVTLRFKLKAAGFDAPVAFLVGGPTIEQIAKRSVITNDTLTPSAARARTRIEQLTAEARPQVELMFPQGAILALQPALPLQEGLVVRSMDSLTPAYLNHLVFCLQGHNHHRIVEAFDNAIVANDILRTCFPRVDDQVVQVVLGQTHIPSPWQYLDLPLSLDPLQAIQASFGQVDDNIVRNIARVPPIRLCLWYGQERTYLAVIIHHSIYDGESLPRLLKEVEDRCTDKDIPERGPFSAVVEYVVGQDVEEAKSFYARYLKDLRPPPALEPVIDGMPGIVYEAIPALSYSDVSERARSANVSLHTYAQAAYAAALAEHFKHEDIMFGAVFSGRVVPVDRAEDIMGPCVTTVPIRARFAHGMSMRDAAQELHRYSVSLLTHQHTPLRLIKRWSGVEQPLFDVLFAFARGEPAPISTDIWEQCVSTTAVDHHLAVEVEAREAENKIFVRAMYTSTFGDHAARAIVNRTRALLMDLDTPINLHGLAVASLLRASRKRQDYAESTWSQTEENIRDAVVDVCDIEPSAVTKNMSFLRLGLDSISSIRLAQRLRDVGIHTRPATIMSNASVGALAAQLSSEGISSAQDDRVAKFQDLSRDFLQTYALAVPLLSVEDAVEAVYPATPLQTAMLSATLASQGTAYVVPHPLRLDPLVDVEKLYSSWHAVLSRLEILRTTFHVGSDLPWVAAVHKCAPLRWKEHDVRNDASRVRQVKQILKSTAVTSIEGFEIPRLEAHIIRSPNETIFMPVAHHSIYDGISLHYILDDVAKMYHGLPIPNRPQFSAALPYVLHRPSGEIEFWRSYLRGCKPTSIRDVLEDETATTHICERRSTLSTAHIDSACQSLEVTTQAAVLLAWGKVMAMLTGRRDVVFGHVVAGRAIPFDNAYDVAGPLFNTIPFRFDISDQTSTNADFTRVQHSLIASTETYQHTPLRDIQSACQLGNLFDTLFVFQNLGRDANAKSDPPIWYPTNVLGEEGEPEYPLNVEIEYGGNNLILRASCGSGVMKAERLAELLTTFDEVLINIIKNPDEPATSFPAALQALPAPSVLADATAPAEAVETNEEPEEWGNDEAILRQVLSDVAQVSLDKIRRHTPLYALGLDSIAAIHVAASCRRQGLLTSVADVVTGGHIEGICARVAARPGQRQNLAQAMITADDREKAIQVLNTSEEKVESMLPVMAGQQYHLAAWLACGRRFYEAPFVFRLPKDVNRARLSAAWQALCERHGILRTTFAALSTDRAIQVVLKHSPGDDSTFAYIETSADLRTKVIDLVKGEVGSPANLLSPPVRARHVHAKDSDAFVIMLHHSLYDGWSIPLLAADLVALYEGAQCESSLGFVDLVEYTFGTRDEAEHRAYWAVALEQAQQTIVKPSSPGNPAGSSAGRPSLNKQHSSLMSRISKGITRWLASNKSASDVSSEVKANNPPATFAARSVLQNVPALTAAALEAHITVPALLIGAAARVISRQTGVTNPVLQHWRTARSAAVDEIERIAGPVLNVLPLHVPNAQGGSLIQVARRVQDALGDSAEHEQVGWAEALQFGGHTGVLSNVQVNVLWHTEHLEARPSSLLELWNLGTPSDIAPKNAIPGQTTVDQLDRSYIPETALGIDVALNSETGHVDLYIKNDVLLEEAVLEDFVKQFKEIIGSGTA